MHPCSCICIEQSSSNIGAELRTWDRAVLPGILLCPPKPLPSSFTPYFCFLARCQRKLTMRLRLPNVPHLQLAKQLAPILLPSKKIKKKVWMRRGGEVWKKDYRLCVWCKWVYFYFICLCVSVSASVYACLWRVDTLLSLAMFLLFATDNKSNNTCALVYLSESIEFEPFWPLRLLLPSCELNERAKLRKISPT